VTGESVEDRDREARMVVNAPLSDWTAVLDVNLIGVMQTDRALARQMLAQGGGGSIINIASTLAKIPTVGSAPYCVSKAAVVMLTQVLALELAPQGIRVNAVGPTYTETPMTAGLRANDATLREAVARVPLGRLSRPEEVAAAVLFLASDEASFFTGETLFPGGGHFHG
jgi:NAD(P)-dependent dehydrogenase (short-subunit alcohol dehydrogenase family)